MGLLRREKEPEPQVNVNVNAADLVEDVSTPDEALAKLTHQLMLRENKEMITELSGQEIIYCAALQTFGKKCQISCIDDFLENLYLLKISKNRQGRKETIELARGSATQRRVTFGDRIKGLLGRG